MRIKNTFLLLASSLILFACSGGRGNSVDSLNPADQKPDTELSTTVGILFETPVQNARYTTSSGKSGITNRQGEFSYSVDEMVSFSFGSLQLAEVAAKTLLTPSDLFLGLSTHADQAVNFLLLLQILDDDQDLSNGVFITDAMHLAISNSNLQLDDLSLSIPAFAKSEKLIQLLDEAQIDLGDKSIEQYLNETKARSMFVDTDADGVLNFHDSDDDNDGVEDLNDTFPFDELEVSDFDADGVGDNADADDDNDGVEDLNDAFPFDELESRDFDADGVGDNADADDDNDGIEDSVDNFQSSIVGLSGLGANLQIGEVLHHESKGYIYLTDQLSKELIVLNDSTGAVIEKVSFEYTPESMALNEVESTLFVALITQPHSSYWWEEDQVGYVAKIDTSTFETIDTFKLSIDPFDMVVTDSNKLVVSSGSGQWTQIYAYNGDTGDILGFSGIRQQSHLSLHPQQNWVFAADTDTSPSDVEKFDISGVGIVAIGDSPYHGEHRIDGNVWVSPNGEHIITRGGGLFLASDMTFVSNLIPVGEYISAVSFSEADNLVTLLLDSGQIIVFNSATYVEIAQIFGIGLNFASYMKSDGIYLLSQSESGMLLVKQPHPCPGCSTNKSPTASFSYLPTMGTTIDDFEFDANASVDPEGEQLQYRWDVNNDGVYESEFSNNPVFKHRFDVPGIQFVSLQTKDSAGHIATEIKVLNVAQGVDSGTEVTDSTPFALQMTVTDSVTDVARSKLYVTDKAAKRLYVVDLTTGATERYFEFKQMPEQMAMKPDGSELYVALLLQEHSSYWWEEDQSGLIAVFDLDAQARVNTLPVNTDPGDLVVTDDDKLIVASGSGQWTDIYAYHAQTGAELGKAGIRQASRLALHPSQNWVFAADTDSSPSDIEKFDISGVGIVAIGDSPYHGEHRIDGNVWVSPGGNYVITRGGDVFLASNMNYVSSLTATGVYIESVVFDDIEGLMFIVDSNGNVAYYNQTSFELVENLGSITNAQSISVIAGQIIVLGHNAGTTHQLTVLAHPCPECSDNTAPTADYSYTPAEGDTFDDYVFDASISVDAEYGASLLYRWDLDNDGHFDTPFSSQTTYVHQFVFSGIKSVGLQVKDSGGLVSSVVKTINVAQGVDSGTEVTDSTPFALQMTVTDSVTDVARSKLYVTDKAAKRLYVVDLTTGATERYFEFKQMPEQMAMKPDGSELYVALLLQEHSSYWWEEDQSGLIAVFDLDAQARVNTLPVNTDPGDLVVTDDDKLIVASGSGQWTDIYAYHAQTGAELGKAGIRQASRLALHPSQNWVFAADTDSSPSDIEKFDISGVGIVAIGDSPYHGEHRIDGNVWVSPGGNYVITRGGDVFLASNMNYVSSLTATGVYIESVVFDDIEGLMFIVDSNGNVAYYNQTSFELVENLGSITNAQSISVIAGQIIVLGHNAGTTHQLTVLAHPCPECSDNTAPTADYSYTPAEGDTFDDYVFDASISVDAEYGASLLYRWDLDNDGHFDTPFSSQTTYVHQFVFSGIKSVGLQVKDSGGLVSSVVKTINVAQGVDSGTEVTDSTPFALQMTVTDSVTDVARSKLYVTDKAAKRLYVVDLTTGATERYFEFKQMPEQMAMKPDGSELYVALLLQEHSSYWWEEDQSGLIAVFDLDAQARVNTLPVNTDPGDLVVTDDDKLIVASGSGQWTDIYAYHAQTGAELGKAGIRQASRLALHPSQNWVFAADTDSSPSDIEKFDISGEGIVAVGDSPYHGDYRMNGNVWASPGGNYVITRGGDVFLASNMNYVSSLTATGVSINAIAFDELLDSLVIVGSDGVIYRYVLSTFLADGNSTDVDDPIEVMFVDGSIMVLSNELTYLLLQTISIED